MNRAIIFLLTGILVALAMASALLKIPQGVFITFVVVLLAGGMVLYMRWLQRAARTPAGSQAYESDERLQAICARVGRPDLQVLVVAGRGLVYLQVENGRLLISPRTLELLTDDELLASVQHALLAPPVQAVPSMLRSMAPAFVLLLAGAVGYAATGSPVTFMVGLVGTLVLSLWMSRKRAADLPEVRTTFRSFLQQGGDARALLSAILKSHRDLLPTIPGKTRVSAARQLRSIMEMFAQEAGISGEVPEIAESAGLSLDFYQVPGPSVERWIFTRVALYAGLLIVSVIVALALSR